MQIVVSGATPSRITIVESGNTVVLQKQISTIVSLTTAGPQGPAFSGQQFFNLSAIGGLTVADSGTTLKWNGTEYVPSIEIGPNLIINGGAF
jgi:hypothetical protein